MFEMHRLHHEGPGTDCRNMILFVTDGKEMDGDVRCTPGISSSSSSSQTKSWSMGLVS